jgi:hypothetical protein
MDNDARAALEDAGYARALERYDEQLARLTDPVWQARYLRQTQSDAAREPERFAWWSRVKTFRSRR